MLYNDIVFLCLVVGRRCQDGELQGSRATRQFLPALWALVVCEIPAAVSQPENK